MKIGLSLFYINTMLGASTKHGMHHSWLAYRASYVDRTEPDFETVMDSRKIHSNSDSYCWLLGL
jgi:hypothetical protein